MMIINQLTKHLCRYKWHVLKLQEHFVKCKKTALVLAIYGKGENLFLFEVQFNLFQQFYI